MRLWQLTGSYVVLWAAQVAVVTLGRDRLGTNAATVAMVLLGICGTSLLCVAAQRSSARIVGFDRRSLITRQFGRARHYPVERVSALWMADPGTDLDPSLKPMLHAEIDGRLFTSGLSTADQERLVSAVTFPPKPIPLEELPRGKGVEAAVAAWLPIASFLVMCFLFWRIAQSLGS